MKYIIFILLITSGTIFGADCACQDDVKVKVTIASTRISVVKSMCLWRYTSTTTGSTDKTPCRDYPLEVSVSNDAGEDTQKSVWSYQSTLTASVTSFYEDYDHREGTRTVTAHANHYAGHCVSSLTKTSETRAELAACCQ